MTPKVSVGDYISFSLRNPSETTSNNVVTASSVAVANSSQSQQNLATITTASENISVREDLITLSYKNNQGKSIWVVGQQ